jgi:hypothetical protein
MPAMPNTSIATFRPLTGVYEPSAIQQLPDGRLLVVEDEKAHPFSLATIGNDVVSAVPLRPGLFEFDDEFWKLDDLEALALHPSGYIYAVTSHSRDGEGREKKSREKLVRFRVDGEDVVDKQVVRGLKAALVAAHPVLASAAAVLDVKNQGGLNIEALEFAPDAGHLWLGFRSPVPNGRAILAAVENPGAVFNADEPLRIAPELLTLSLDGYGLRGMAWVASLAGYLLIAGPMAQEQVPFGLWFWSGQADTRPRRVGVPGLPGFAHAEGVCPAIIEGREVIVIVSDDGDRAAGRCAGYLLLEPDQLSIEP